MSGCGTELFVPQINSNWDCILCLDCARACPYDNVALAPRRPLAELVNDTWPHGWDLTLLAFVFVFASLGNAFGMVPPVYALEAWLAARLDIQSEAILLLLIFTALYLAAPAGYALGAAFLSRTLSGGRESLRQVAARYAPAFIPLGFGVWLAHYGFHFATGALTIVPVFQSFLLDLGAPVLGPPNWALGPILPQPWLLPLQGFLVLGGLLASLYVLGERARRAHPRPAAMALSMLPWLVGLLVLAVAAVYIFTLPMEMRGTIGFAP